MSDARGRAVRRLTTHGPRGGRALVALLALATLPAVAHAQHSRDAVFTGRRALEPAVPNWLSIVPGEPHPVPRGGDPGAPSAPVIAGQVALGTLATPVGYVGGGLTTRWAASRVGAGEDAARRVAYVGAFAGAALTTATTVHYLGRTGRVSGDFPATVGGAVVGQFASWGVVELGRALYRDAPTCNVLCRTLGISAFVLPSIGATVGHAVTRDWR